MSVFLKLLPLLVLTTVMFVGIFPISDFLILKGLGHRENSIIAIYGVASFVGGIFAGWVLWKRLPEHNTIQKNKTSQR